MLGFAFAYNIFLASITIYYHLKYQKNLGRVFFFCGRETKFPHTRPENYADQSPQPSQFCIFVGIAGKNKVVLSIT